MTFSKKKIEEEPNLWLDDKEEIEELKKDIRIRNSLTNQYLDSKYKNIQNKK